MIVGDVGRELPPGTCTFQQQFPTYRQKSDEQELLDPEDDALGGTDLMFREPDTREIWQVLTVAYQTCIPMPLWSFCLAEEPITHYRNEVSASQSLVLPPLAA